MMKSTSDTKPLPLKHTCSAFAGFRRIAQGDLAEVVAMVKGIIERSDWTGEPVLIFDDRTSETIDVDFQGSIEEVLAGLPKAAAGEAGAGGELAGREQTGPGRPKLGVIGREVTLLPRHWDWLSRQPGGASVTLRKLVEAAKRSGAGEDRARVARESAYRFMVAVAGDLPGFEEASRVLFAKSPDRFPGFENLVQAWPADVRAHLLQLIKAVELGEAEAGAGNPDA